MNDEKEKTTNKYWDSLWEKREIPQAVDPSKRGLGNHIARQYHAFFEPLLCGRCGQSILEIGCAGSPWLPYFARQFDLKVTGLDRSVLGCKQAKEVLSRSGVKGQIVNADLFSPPDEILEAFDIVISFGVVEHFMETEKCVYACSRFLRPGGLMITVIPNLAGWMGRMQKHLDRKIYDIHVPLDRKDLRMAHEMAGLDVSSCNYFLLLSFGVLNFTKFSKERPHLWPLAWRIRAILDRIAWLSESWLPYLCHSNRWTSPYIVCVAEKPGAGRPS
jgi:cyclopropane fatty-acyl-phospholipid synthase-like methyltransferase